MNKIKVIFAIACLSMLFGMNASAEVKTSTLEDAFKNGKFSGKVQAYYEVTEDSDDDSFAVATFKLKYQTAKWNNFQLGVEAYAASQLYDSGNAYQKDFDSADGGDNTVAALSEIYLKYFFTEKSFIQAGRWNHKKVSRGHLEDSHSEGVNIQFNDVDNLKLNLGVITQTAEFDYDDFENWGDGSSTGQQDFSDNATYGEATPYLLFVDAEYAFSDSFSINPYLYFQDDYATVFGSDASLEFELSECAKAGVDATVYAVEVDGLLDVAGDEGDGGQVFGLLPYVTIGDLRLGVGAVHFTQGNVRPRWFNDYITSFDQERAYPDVDQEAVTAYQATAEYKLKSFKIRYGIQQWEGEDQVDELEQELIFGYKFTKKFDGEIRLFNVDRENSEDYEKIEARLRYKF